MIITYFKDTDTLLVTFNDNKVEETKDISENVLLDLDADKNIVSMTVEHATYTATISNFAFNQIADKKVA
ncbi:MAG: DUF2283 domain-containing protein [Bacteroidota bacterium]